MRENRLIIGRVSPKILEKSYYLYDEYLCRCEWFSSCAEATKAARSLKDIYKGFGFIVDVLMVAGEKENPITFHSRPPLDKLEQIG